MDNSTAQLSPLVQKFVDEVTKKYSPNFVIRDKTHKTGLYAAASFFGKIFNKDIDTKYITQTLNECWIPPSILSYRDADLIKIIAHETMHERDRKEWSSFVAFLVYGSPQLLAVFSLLSLFAPVAGLGWLWCLLFLLFLAPIPAPGRMWMELRAYRVNMLVLRHVHKYSEETLKVFAEDFANQFTSSSYYFMWPFRAHIVGLLQKEGSHPYYEEVKAWLVANNVTP